MAGKSKSWTPERRATQSARMKENQIWLHSTGPKTPEGKNAVRLNAWKHGLRSAEMAALSKLLTAQTNYVRAVLKGAPLPRYPRDLASQNNNNKDQQSAPRR